MDKPPKMLFGTLKFAQRCGAKTRQGGRCQNIPMQLGGRCRMHGGAALRGPAHPRYKDGKYSRYKPVEPETIEELIARINAEPPIDLSELLADLPPFDWSDLILE
jgi:hypothetical protein